MASSRDDLLDAAIAALNQHPTATLAEVAAAIGVSRATLHRHFSSRDALIAEMAERALDRWSATQDAAGIDEATASGDAARLESALRTMVRAYVTDADDFGFVLTDEASFAIPEIATRTDAILEREHAFYAAAQAAGVLRSDLPVRWFGHVVYGFMVAARDALRYGDVARRDLDLLVETTILGGIGR